MNKLSSFQVEYVSLKDGDGVDWDKKMYNVCNINVFLKIQ